MPVHVPVLDANLGSAWATVVSPSGLLIGNFAGPVVTRAEMVTKVQLPYQYLRNLDSGARSFTLAARKRSVSALRGAKRS